MRKLSKTSNNQTNTLEGIASFCNCRATCRSHNGVVDTANFRYMNDYARDYNVTGVGPNEIGTEV